MSVESAYDTRSNLSSSPYSQAIYNHGGADGPSTVSSAASTHRRVHGQTKLVAKYLSVSIAIRYTSIRLTGSARVRRIRKIASADSTCAVRQRSGADALETGPVLLRKKLGEGGFRVITHVWNVSTGDEYALKEPSEKAIEENRVDIDGWEREADIIKRFPHVN